MSQNTLQPEHSAGFYWLTMAASVACCALHGDYRPCCRYHSTHVTMESTSNSTQQLPLYFVIWNRRISGQQGLSKNQLNYKAINSCAIETRNESIHAITNQSSPYYLMRLDYHCEAVLQLLGSSPESCAPLTAAGGTVDSGPYGPG